MTEVTLTEAGKRMSDIYNGLIVAHPIGDLIGKWAAFSLADGNSDGEIYDTRNDAIKHQQYEQQCCYIMLGIGGMDQRAASSYMEFYRAAYDAGGRVSDPDTPVQYQRQLVMPLAREDLRSQISRLGRKSGVKLYRNGI